MVSTPATWTCLVDRTIGKPYRVIHNKDVDEILKLEARGTTIEEILPYINGKQSRMSLYEGNIDADAIACGQAVGLIHDIPTVKELVQRIMSQADEVAKSLQATARA